jgi:hypothetical protein
VRVWAGNQAGRWALSFDRASGKQAPGYPLTAVVTAALILSTEGCHGQHVEPYAGNRLQ